MEADKSFFFVLLILVGSLSGIQCAPCSSGTPVASVSSQNPPCAGGTGSLTATAVGGLSPYTYSLNNGAYVSSSVFTGLAAGTYTITAKDSTGCISAYVSKTLVAPSAVVLSAVATNPTCQGSSDGKISVTAVGGSGTGYTYSLNGGAFSAVSAFTNLAAGSYSLVARDSNGCISAAVVRTLTSPSAVVVSATAVNPTCYGGSDGKISAVAVGGSGAGYTYSLNGGAFTVASSFTGLAAGTYTIQAKDNRGCISASISRTLATPTAVVVSATATDPTCYGGSDGKISAVAVGGSGTGFTYSFNGGAFSAVSVFTGLAAGTYTIQARDNRGCISASISRILAAPTAVVVSGTTTNPTCYGGSDGKISAAAVGGSGAGYTYSFNGGAFSTTSVIIGPAGTYTIQAKDSKGCTSASVSKILAAPAAVVVTATATNPTCQGSANGKISVVAVGGSGTYIYSLNGGAFTSASSFANLIAGTYTIVAKDSKGCSSASVSSTLVSPSAVVVATVATNPSCKGSSDGKLSVTASGGSGKNYMYSLNGGAFTTTTSFILAAGKYTVAAKDSAGCISAAVTSTLVNPAAVVVTATAVTNPSCYGSVDGSFSVVAVGGTGTGYTYSVNGGAYSTTTTYNGNAAGSYTIRARDSKGCISVDLVITLSSPTEVVISAVPTDPTCAGCDDGELALSAAGGTGSGYTYSVNGGTYSATTPVVGLPEGTYTIFARDSNSCVSDSLQEILVA